MGYPSIRAAVLALHADGRTPHEIAAEIQRDRRSVFAVLCGAGISSRRAPPAGFSSVKQATARLGNRGYSVQEIADRVGSSERSVKTMLCVAGLNAPAVPFTERLVTDPDDLAGLQAGADARGLALDVFCRRILQAVVRADLVQAVLDDK